MALSSLRNLLSGSLTRAGIMRSVDASMVVEAANRALPAYLPSTRSKDIIAISYKDGVVHLAAKTAAARFSIKGQETELLTNLQQQFPTLPMNKVTIKLQRPTPQYEFS
jgi:hypothetical protein